MWKLSLQRIFRQTLGGQVVPDCYISELSPYPRAGAETHLTSKPARRGWDSSWPLALRDFKPTVSACPCTVLYGG